MGADARPLGERAAGGRGAAWPWTSSGALCPPLPLLPFLFLFLAAPSVRAAGYEVSGSPRAEMSTSQRDAPSRVWRGGWVCSGVA